MSTVAVFFTVCMHTQQSDYRSSVYYWQSQPLLFANFYKVLTRRHHPLEHCIILLYRAGHEPIFCLK